MQKNKQSKKTPKKSSKNPVAGRSEYVPAAIGVTARSQLPRIYPRSQDSINICRREFVGSFTNGTNVGFYVIPLCSSVPGYDINPGCAPMFPWLCTLAGNFERFRFNRLKVNIIPSQPTSSAGRYYVAVDYDYDDAVPSSKIVMMGNRTAAEAPVWQELSIECVTAELHRDMPTKYVSLLTRNNYIEARTAFCGYFIFATDSTVQSMAFDVWVEYDIDLISPVNDSAFIQDSYSTSATLVAVSNTTTALGSAFADNPSYLATSDGPLKVVVPGSLGVPAMNISLFTGTRAATAAIDLSPAGGRGKLNYISRNTVTGTTPAAAMAAGMSGDAVLFDSSGKQLGVASSISNALRTIGCVNPAVVSTAGGELSTVLSLYLSKLLGSFATARYLVPLITSSSALGAGTGLGAIQFEL